MDKPAAVMGPAAMSALLPAVIALAILILAAVMAPAVRMLLAVTDVAVRGPVLTLPVRTRPVTDADAAVNELVTLTDAPTVTGPAVENDELVRVPVTDTVAIAVNGPLLVMNAAVTGAVDTPAAVSVPEMDAEMAVMAPTTLALAPDVRPAVAPRLAAVTDVAVSAPVLRLAVCINPVTELLAAVTPPVMDTPAAVTEPDTDTAATVADPLVLNEFDVMAPVADKKPTVTELNDNDAAVTGPADTSHDAPVSAPGVLRLALVTAPGI